MPFTCPGCSARIAWRDTSSFAKPFPCPQCGRELRFNKSYLRTTDIGGLAIAAVVSYTLGIRWLNLMIATVLAGILVSLSLKVLIRNWFDHVLQLYADDDSIRSILHGPPRD
jgi:hypothetical protein